MALSSLLVVADVAAKYVKCLSNLPELSFNLLGRVITTDCAAVNYRPSHRGIAASFRAHFQLSSTGLVQVLYAVVTQHYKILF